MLRSTRRTPTASGSTICSNHKIGRRSFVRVLGAAAVASLNLPRKVSGQSRGPHEFALRYILASPMYGTASLDDVLGEVHRVGATAIDVWPERHANHREQIDALGVSRVKQMLEAHRVKIAVSTRYDLGPYRLRDEIRFVKDFGGELVVCGAVPQKGDSLKQRVRRFVEQMKPHAEYAAEQGVTIGIENHAHNLLDSADAVQHFADLVDFPNFGIALAPYHLPQDSQLIARVIEHLGNRLVFFQAWQHGKGAVAGLSKDDERLQMPGRGPLDFVPLLAALKKIGYSGWTEIFMHPTPRGISIRETIAETTAEINASRDYLEGCLQKIG